MTPVPGSRITTNEVRKNSMLIPADGIISRVLAKPVSTAR
jgi:hypothetical protein